MKQQLRIYTTFQSERLRYILDVIFKSQLGVAYQLITDWEVFQQAAHPKLNYSTQILEGVLQIRPHTLLKETTITPIQIEVKKQNEQIYFFETHPSGQLPFDLLSASFFLLSRYEEYIRPDRDEHNRFPAAASMAFEHQFLHLPLVDLWIKDLKTILQSTYPSLKFRAHQFRFQSTFDIDLAWAYQHRSWHRTIGGILKDGITDNWKNLNAKFAVWLGQQSDPYFCFDYIMELHQHCATPPMFFFLLGKYGKYDKNISPHRPAFQQLIRALAKHYIVGIHPSYQSNFDMEQLSHEIQQLQNITQQRVVNSRQHYLKLELPTTYRHLLLLSIKKDHTMGYADAIGFRASTSHPFLFFDLLANRTTALQIHPFQVMDVTLKSYLQWTPTQAFSALEQLIINTQAVGGTFTTLWHNSSFSSIEGWTKWRWIYEQLIQKYG